MPVRRLALLLLLPSLLLPAAPVRAVPSAPPHAAESTVAWGRLMGPDNKPVAELVKAVIVLGNAPPADVVLDDKTVAAQHARLTWKDGVVMVEDLGSRFGTLLNGTALKKGKPVRILTRSTLSLGAVTLTFQLGPRPGLIPPTQPKKKGKAK